MGFQLGSALLDACVLAVLDDQDAYGYVLTQSVKQVMDISESTLYPVLRRLQKDQCLITIFIIVKNAGQLPAVFRQIKAILRAYGSRT